MRKHALRLAAIGVGLALAMPATVFATNGYFLIGFGAKSRGMGGVGVALPQDGLAAASNPAGMADVNVSTMRVDAGMDLFQPPRAVRHDSATLPVAYPASAGGAPEDNLTDGQSGSNLFLVPNMGGLYRFNKKLTVGMAAIGAGLGTRYDQTVRDPVTGVDLCHDGDPSTQGSYFFNFNCNAAGSSLEVPGGTEGNTVGVMLMQMQMLPSAAYRINKNHTIGGSMAIGLQMFRAYGLTAFQDLGFAASKEHVSNNGNDWSYGAGARFGYLGKFFDKKLWLGVNYSSRVYMTEFDQYENLFAEHGDFDIPESYAIGMSFHPNEKLVIAADIQQINFSSIASVGNPGPSAADPDDFNPLCPGADTDECKVGGDLGLGFGWDDQTVYKIGAAYTIDDHWTVRGGYNYGKAPVPDDQILFNLLAPGVVEHHLTLGATYKQSENIEWSFSYVHAFENCVNGPTAFGPTGAPVDGSNASACMYQNALGVSIGYSL
jgi:long-chain fatty acid transport protein